MTNQVTQRISRFTHAWTELAPGATFAGMTLAEFRAAVQASIDERAAIASLGALRSAAIARKNAADAASRDAMFAVANAVRADSAHGPDGALYRALGYVPKSERRSGLTRKVNATAATQVSLPKAA